MDKLVESSNAAQPSVPEAEPACLRRPPIGPPAPPPVQGLANLVNSDWMIRRHSAVNKCVVTQGRCNQEGNHRPAFIQPRRSPAAGGRSQVIRPFGFPTEHNPAGTR